MRKHAAGITAFIDTHLTNAAAEGLNRIIRMVKNRASGFKTLVAIVKKQLQVDRSLSEILQILTVSLFEKVDILQVFTKTHLQNETEHSRNQLNLFDL